MPSYPQLPPGGVPTPPGLEQVPDDVMFGDRTVGWYKYAFWFAHQIAGSHAQAQLANGPQAFAILCKGDELGLKPFAAWAWIYTTKAGRLALQSKGALAVVQASPVYEDYEERIEQDGTPEMRGVAIAHRKGKKPVVKEFTLKDAERAGLLKEGRTREGNKFETTYQLYLKDMLLSRARARALDIAFADVLGGIAIEGVAEDVDNLDAQKNAQTVPVAEAPAPPRRDPLLAKIGRKELAPAPEVPKEPDLAPVEAPAPVPVEVEVVPPPAKVPPRHEPPKRKDASKVFGAVPKDERPQVKHGDPCPRCGVRLNAMLGCDACGWPGEMFR